LNLVCHLDMENEILEEYIKLKTSLENCYKFYIAKKLKNFVKKATSFLYSPYIRLLRIDRIDIRVFSKIMKYL